MRVVTATELDRAVAAGRTELTRANARAVRCTLRDCRVIIAPGEGRRLFIDGHARGFLCARDARGVRPDPFEFNVARMQAATEDL